LHGLFDLVLLGKTWQRLGVTSPWITRLAALPYEQVNVPLVYKGIKVKYMEDESKEYYLFGGVRVRMAASVNAVLLAEQAALKNLRLGASSRGGAVARRLDQVRLVLPAGTTRRTQALDIAAVLALLRRGDVTTASNQLQRLSEAEPFDPELWCLRAMLHLQQKSYEAALADAGRALELDAENPRIVAAASIIQFEANFLTGRTEPALESIERAVRALPESSRAHILKGDALAALQQTADARAEYREALRLDPNSMMANVSFGLLELSEGWVVRGSKLIEKARLQTRVEADVPTVKAALALAEIGISILGDTETHLAKASDYAREVIADPASDPLSRIRALFAQTQLALIRDDAPAAENFVKQALGIAPANPTPLIALAYWAHEQKRDELARRYLNSAEQLAPDHPAVKKLRALMRNTP
jgi:Flp pilus assembly protein TadD